jgi:hypothetical protein
VCLGIPEQGFRYTAGKPKTYKRADLDKAVTREFCDVCGTHIITRAPAAPGVVILKRGTLDEPAAYGNPQMAIFLCDRQPFHHIGENVMVFEKAPR